jgi:hypothetical protein
MAPQVGTYDISQLLDTRFDSVSAIEFGMDTLAETVQRDLDAHNAVVNEMVRELAEPTTDRLRTYGTGATGEMIEVDEFGRSETQTSAPGSNVSFPLRLFQYGIGWTKKYMERATVRDIALQTNAAQKAHLRRLRYDIKRALFFSANYTYNDHLVDRVNLSVKRLVNADSATIPDGPDGGTFTASSHTHYNGASSLDTTAADALITDLIEHGHGSNVMIAINFADVGGWEGLSGFVKATPVYVATNAYNVATTAARTDPANQYNRLVGYYGGAAVWVKPWGIDNYPFAWDAGAADKPLAFRQRNVAAPLQGLRVAAELDTYPLYAKYFEAEFGFGVWTRTNGVVLKTDNATYADPTITQ